MTWPDFNNHLFTFLVILRDMLVSWAWGLTLLAAALGCELVPSDDAPPKSPGDNFYRVIVNGEVERYAPNQRYVGEFRSGI